LDIARLLDFSFGYRKNVVLDSTTRRPILDPATGKPVEMFHPMIPCIISSADKKSPLIEAFLTLARMESSFPRVLQIT